MDIREEIIDFMGESPIAVKIYGVRHYEPHFHPHSLELIYCVDGKISITAGHQHVTLSKNELFTIDCTDIHFLHSDEDNVIISLYIDLTRVHADWEYLRYVFFACETAGHQGYQSKPLQDVQDILLSIAYLSACETGVSSFTAEKDADVVYTDMANRLVDILLEYFDWFYDINTFSNSNDQIKERFYSITSFCQKNYMDKITISQLAKAEHINENYFSQFLLKSSFQGFSNMLNYVRCFESETLLLLTDLPISEISSRCGFSDVKYYYRHFKKWWGATPHQHRKAYETVVGTPMDHHELTQPEALETIKNHIAFYHVDKSIKN